MTTAEFIGKYVMGDHGDGQMLVDLDALVESEREAAYSEGFHKAIEGNKTYITSMKAEFEVGALAMAEYLRPQYANYWQHHTVDEAVASLPREGA